MIHAYHVIWGAYGFWLPNDPRGSWSDFVASWELRRFGEATQSMERHEVEQQAWSQWRTGAEGALKYPAVHLTGRQARAVGTGLGRGILKSKLTVWACSILPEHVHLVLARHTYKVEQICNLLKGEATKALKEEGLHPCAEFVDSRGRIPSAWAEGQWKSYLDDEESIEMAIRYVEENPLKENKPRQVWSFVTPFTGIPKSGWTTYR
jgi:REP element-mobilizing transposase RayT